MSFNSMFEIRSLWRMWFDVISGFDDVTEDRKLNVDSWERVCVVFVWVVSGLVHAGKADWEGESDEVKVSHMCVCLGFGSWQFGGVRTESRSYFTHSLSQKTQPWRSWCSENWTLVYSKWLHITRIVHTSECLLWLIGEFTGVMR